MNKLLALVLLMLLGFVSAIGIKGSQAKPCQNFHNPHCSTTTTISSSTPSTTTSPSPPPPPTTTCGGGNNLMSMGWAGSLGKPSLIPPALDTTSFIDDIGIDGNGGTILANNTNLDKYSVLTIGADYTHLGLAGRNIRYANGNSINDGDSDTSVSVATARANHWLIYTDAGHVNEIQYAGNPGQYLVDFGNTAFQSDWLTRITTLFTNHPGVAGLFIDNYSNSLQAVGGPAYPVYRYDGSVLWASDADYQATVINFAQNCLAYVKDTLGKLVVVNGKAAGTGSDQGTPTLGWMDQIHTYINGIFIEYWLSDVNVPNQAMTRPGKISTGGLTYWDYWDEWRLVHQHANSYATPLGYFPMNWMDMSHSAATRAQEQRYMRATYLLDWNGGGPNHLGSWVQKPHDHSSDLWTSAMDFDPGQPLGAAIQLNEIDGCWKRQFERGTVYVNASWSTQTLDSHSIASGDALFVP